MDYLELGPTPVSEECEQLGPNYNPQKAIKEAKAYCNQLERLFNKEMETGIYFKSKGFPHDFGTYYEACVIFNDNDEDQCEAAYHIEGNLPENWDEQAKIELTIKAVQ